LTKPPAHPGLIRVSTAVGEQTAGRTGPDAVRKTLMVAVAQLHIWAGWAGFDAGLYGRAMAHYARGLQLAHSAVTASGSNYW